MKPVHVKNEVHLVRTCAADAARIARALTELLDRGELLSREQIIAIRNDVRLIGRDLAAVDGEMRAPSAAEPPLDSESITKLRAAVRAGK